MKRCLTSYSPRVRPLFYDSLKNRRGCQTISGNDKFGSLAFIELCLGRPDDFTKDEKVTYQKSRQISYCDGPATAGVVQADKFKTRWAAWVATAGIRVGQYSSITLPADNLGNPSALYPATKPAHISLGFNRAGLMAMAIAKDAGNIELKRFTNTGGATDTKTWAGQSPQLFNNWLLYYDLDDPTGYDLVCYYLKDASPGNLYARFERDGFTVEYTIHSGLPADISYLVSTDVFEAFEQQILAISPNGDFITITSPQYYIHKTEHALLTNAMIGGAYVLTAYPVDFTALREVSTLTTAMVGGSTSHLYNQDLTSLRDVSTLTVAMTGGQYNMR